MKVLLQLIYLGWWFFRARFLGRRKPLQSVVFVTNGCNSTCRHCTHCTKSEGFFCKSFADIEKDLDYCYGQGARMLDIEGVHLLQWKDGELQVNDIFSLAKGKGFFSVSTMVPAADYAAWQALQAKVDAVLEFLQQHKDIRQIAFNFHTPFAGTEHLALSQQQREEVINQLIAYKHQGHRIMNSISGLKNMLSLRFKRHCWICNFIYCDGRRSPQCIDNMDSGICQCCGFSMAGEMNAVFNMKPDTILEGLGIRI